MFYVSFTSIEVLPDVCFFCMYIMSGKGVKNYSSSEHSSVCCMEWNFVRYYRRMWKYSYFLERDLILLSKSYLWYQHTADWMVFHCNFIERMLKNSFLLHLKWKSTLLRKYLLWFMLTFILKCIFAVIIQENLNFNFLRKSTFPSNCCFRSAFDIKGMILLPELRYCTLSYMFDVPFCRM